MSIDILEIHEAFAAIEIPIHEICDLGERNGERRLTVNSVFQITTWDSSFAVYILQDDRRLLRSRTYTNVGPQWNSHFDNISYTTACECLTAALQELRPWT